METKAQWKIIKRLMVYILIHRYLLSNFLADVAANAATMAFTLILKNTSIF